jgi:hypothetical protein
MAKKLTDEQVLKAAACIVKFCGEEEPLAEYLKLIMLALWEEGESFSGKRPLGDSGWQWDVAGALIREKIVPGKLDADGIGPEEFEWSDVDNVVQAVIKRFVIKA